MPLGQPTGPRSSPPRWRSSLDESRSIVFLCRGPSALVVLAEVVAFAILCCSKSVLLFCTQTCSFAEPRFHPLRHQVIERALHSSLRPQKLLRLESWCHDRLSSARRLRRNFKRRSLEVVMELPTECTDRSSAGGLGRTKAFQHKHPSAASYCSDCSEMPRESMGATCRRFFFGAQVNHPSYGKQRPEADSKF